MTVKYSFCRICAGKCGLVVEVNDTENRIASIRGDHENPMTQGYACIKGLQAGELHHSAHRLLKPLERQADGSFQEIALETALDRIAERLRQIIDRDGADALATFRGTQHYANTSAFHMLSSFIKATGTRSRFSTMTIDQSAKWVADHRLGSWGAGRQGFADADVWMFIGYNPLVSVQGINGFPALNPLKRLKAAKKRGMKIIVVDPRQSETAKHADIHLQIKPGQDPVFLAGLLRIILKNQWHDIEFCHQYVDGVDALFSALTLFTPDFPQRSDG
jgi:anaerobic selenocysteine-containing dehydrogenase